LKRDGFVGGGFIRTTGAVVVATAIFSVSFLFRFNDPSGSFAGLTDDHFFYLVRGWQILFGDLPVRDFVDHGAPLFYYVGAAVQLIGGRGTLSEIVFCTAAISLGAAATCLLATRASGSVVLGGLAGLVQILLDPRLYNYPKIVVYAAAVPALWAFADRPSARRRFAIALITAVAFLFRHDHGVFVAIAMVSLIALLRPVSWRGRCRHAAIYGALVVALLAPYLMFVEVNGGVVPYLGQTAAWAERDRARAPVEWPGLFENPEGQSEAARTGSLATRAVAMMRDNDVAWLFHLEVLLPFAAFVALLASPDAFRPDWPHAAAKIRTVALLGLLLNAGFLRSPLEARLADPSVPHAILIAWLCAAAWRLLRRGAASLPPRLAPHATVVAGSALLLVGGMVAVLGITLTKDLDRRLAGAALTEGPAGALDRAAGVRETLRSTWPLESWTGPEPQGVMQLTFYLRDCTKPTDRVFMQHYLPQVLALSQRAFAGGHADLRAGFFTTPEAQRLTLDRLVRQSVPVLVLAAGDEYADFRESFPLIARYFDEHYQPAGVRVFDDRFGVTLLVSRTAVSTGHYRPLDWPCFG
jgi:hypothetical protein